MVLALKVAFNTAEPNKLDINSKKEADKICEIIKSNLINVSKYETKETSTRAYAPFITSTLYQSAASILDWSSDRTAKIAQDIYTSGLITYIRTDSTFIVPEFINDIKSNIITKY